MRLTKSSIMMMAMLALFQGLQISCSTETKAEEQMRMATEARDDYKTKVAYGETVFSLGPYGLLSEKEAGDLWPAGKIPLDVGLCIENGFDYYIGSVNELGDWFDYSKYHKRDDLRRWGEFNHIRQGSAPVIDADGNKRFSVRQMGWYAKK
ncbi:MAG: hypothetical protein ABIC95_03585 [archaeon]